MRIWLVGGLVVVALAGCGGSKETKSLHILELSNAAMASAMVGQFELTASPGFGRVDVTCVHPKRLHFACAAYHVVTKQQGRDLASVTNYSVVVDEAAEPAEWSAITSDSTELPSRLRGHASDGVLFD